MKTGQDLKQLLEQIDRKGYPAYKTTKGLYKFGEFVLGIDSVQGDPFAAPSRLHIEIPGDKAKYPSVLFDEIHKRIALQDKILRTFGESIKGYSFQAKGSGKSGMISVSRCHQQVLCRSACEIHRDSGKVTIRFFVGFPANGRTINSRELIKVLFEYLPRCVKTLFYDNMDKESLRKIMELSVDREFIKTTLRERGLVAFVANGSVLPRESGVSEKPMKNAVLFQSPGELEIDIDLPFKGKITGMGIRRGVTLIVGGGYHGKSTLLKALERAVYPHIHGDGREYIVTDESSMKIRAEDGRSIKNTDISLFIKDLPNKKDTVRFSTEDASGSTSQAANVVEAIEAGAKALLIDEDTSATNFMVRDELMQQVIHRDQEPITPFIERMRGIYEKWGISTIIVAGSSGAYFHTADTIIQMDNYVPVDITLKAKKAAKGFSGPEIPVMDDRQPCFARCPKRNTGLEYKGRIKIKTHGVDGVSLNNENIDMRYVEQLVDSEQLTFLGYFLRYVEDNAFDGHTSIGKIIDSLYGTSGEGLLDRMFSGRDMPGDLALSRRNELFTCINRYRGLNMK